MKKIIIISIFAFISQMVISQSVGIGKEKFTPDTSAALDIRSENKGLLIPRLNLKQKLEIPNPATGLLIFQTDHPSGFYYFDGNRWKSISVAEKTDLSLINDFLKINNNDSVDLSVYYDNTDEQEISLENDLLQISGSEKVVDLSIYRNASGESQELSLSNVSDLTISGGNTISLAGLLDNTDNQYLLLENNLLKISGNASGVDLSKYHTPPQTLTLSGAELSIANGNTVDLSGLGGTGTTQNLALSGNSLSISGGNTVDLSGFANTDAQELSLTGNSLSIDNGNAVNLAYLLDNTDGQTLTLSGTDLSIANGNTVDLSGLGGSGTTQNLALSGNSLSISDGNSVDLSSFANTDAQELSLTGNSLSIDNGNTVDLSGLETEYQDLNFILPDKLGLTNSDTWLDVSRFYDNTDNQTLELTGYDLAITGGNKVDLSGVGNDNLGNHTASQNITLGNYFISNDGSDNGIAIAGDGRLSVRGKGYFETDVDVSGDLQVNGRIRTPNLNVDKMLGVRYLNISTYGMVFGPGYSVGISEMTGGSVYTVKLIMPNSDFLTFQIFSGGVNGAFTYKLSEIPGVSSVTEQKTLDYMLFRIQLDNSADYIDLSLPLGDINSANIFVSSGSVGNCQLFYKKEAFGN